MKSTNSISESKLAVQREYFNNLELEYQEQYHQFFDGKVRIIDDRHLRVLLQMQFFGNPASPSIRGGK